MKEIRLLEPGERLSEEDLDESRREAEAFRFGAAGYMAGLGPRKEPEHMKEYRAFMAAQEAKSKGR